MTIQHNLNILIINKCVRDKDIFFYEMLIEKSMAHKA